MDAQGLLDPITRPGPLYNGVGLVTASGGMYWIYNHSAEWYNLLFGGGFIAAGIVSWVCNEIRWTASERTKEAERHIAESFIGSEEYYRELAKEQQTARNRPADPPINVYNKPVQAYAQVVERVEQLGSLRERKIDRAEQVFAGTLVMQRDNGYTVNMTEGFWVGNQEVGWTNREPLVALLTKWKYYKIVSKGPYKNSKHEIENWKAVELISTGTLKLPPPPPGSVS